MSKSFCAAKWLCLLCFRPLSARSLIGYCFVSRDNLKIMCAFVLGVPPPHIRISDAPRTFFRADSVTLNTPHTTGKSDKIIFRSTKIIGTLPRIVGRGEIGPKSARLSCGVYPALDYHSFTHYLPKLKVSYKNISTLMRLWTTWNWRKHIFYTNLPTYT